MWVVKLSDFSLLCSYLVVWVMLFLWVGLVFIEGMCSSLNSLVLVCLWLSRVERLV